MSIQIKILIGLFLPYQFLSWLKLQKQTGKIGGFVLTVSLEDGRTERCLLLGKLWKSLITLSLKKFGCFSDSLASGWSNFFRSIKFSFQSITDELYSQLWSLADPSGYVSVEDPCSGSRAASMSWSLLELISFNSFWIWSRRWANKILGHAQIVIHSCTLRNSRWTR